MQSRTPGRRAAGRRGGRPGTVTDVTDAGGVAAVLAVVPPEPVSNVDRVRLTSELSYHLVIMMTRTPSA